MYFPLSILARGSDVGVMRFMTCRIRCLSSPSSCICWSSTEATSIRPGVAVSNRGPAKVVVARWAAHTVKADDLSCVDHLDRFAGTSKRTARHKNVEMEASAIVVYLSCSLQERMESGKEALGHRGRSSHHFHCDHARQSHTPGARLVSGRYCTQKSGVGDT